MLRLNTGHTSGSANGLVLRNIWYLKCIYDQTWLPFRLVTDGTLCVGSSVDRAPHAFDPERGSGGTLSLSRRGTLGALRIAMLDVALEDARLGGSLQSPRPLDALELTLESAREGALTPRFIMSVFMGTTKSGS
jgi:hypothetical protein